MSAKPIFAVVTAQTPGLNRGRPGRAVLAIASHPDERELPAFYGVTTEKRGAVSIARLVTASGPADTFSFEDNLSTATIRPPAPFAGSATFTRNPGAAPTWAGDLTLDLPGRADVSMTGTDFAATLRHDLPTD